MASLSTDTSLSDLRKPLDKERDDAHSSFQQRNAITSDISKRRKTPSTAAALSYCSKKIVRLREWRQRQGLLQLWLWESACCILSISSLIAIIMTLRTHEHKTLPQWPYGLSINALLATYIFVLKASAGFVLAEGISHLKWTALFQAQLQSLRSFVAHDDASRGPLGSIKLLYQNKGWGVSSLGALITILALLIDPFAQQIVRYYDCPKISLTEHATIARTNVLAPAHRSTWNDIFMSRAFYNDVRIAVNTGIFAVHLPDVPFSCPTGNCSFTEPYTTIGYCSSCEDKTHELVFTEYRLNYSGQEFIHTNVSLNNAGSDSALTLQRDPSGSDSLVSSTTFLGGDVRPMDSFCRVIDIIRWVGSETQRAESEVVQAYTCKLYPCIRTYKASVTGGKLVEYFESESEYIYAEVSNQNPASQWTVADLNCLEKPEEQRQILKDLGFKIDKNSRWIPYNVSIDVTSETLRLQPHLKAPEDICTTSSENASNTLCDNNLISDALFRTVPPRCLYNLRGPGDAIWLMILNGSLNEKEIYHRPNEVLIALWNAGSGNGTLEDVQGFMRKVADSVTTYIRQPRFNGPDWLHKLNEPAIGEVIYNTTCVRIRWTWITYPASLIGMLILFFVFTIVQSKKQQAQLPGSLDFKSNALTLLFHGFDYESQRKLEHIGGDNRTKELQEKTKDFRVKLLQTEQGWKFVVSVDVGEREPV